jgi:hypothetical protein
MTPIVRIEHHPKQPNLLVVHAGPDAGPMMGGFGPARWQAKSRAYWIPTPDLEKFIRYLDLKGATLVDERAVGGPSGPLPECRACGQPAKRGAELRFCPACRARWEPVVHASAIDDDTARAHCPTCGRAQAGNFDGCQHCGQVMPVRDVTAVRPVIPARPKTALADPVAFGQVIEGTDPDGQLPLAPEPAEATP